MSGEGEIERSNGPETPVREYLSHGTPPHVPVVPAIRFNFRWSIAYQDRDRRRTQHHHTRRYLNTVLHPPQPQPTPRGSGAQRTERTQSNQDPEAVANRFGGYHRLKAV